LAHPHTPLWQWNATPATLNFVQSLPQEPQLLSSVLVSVSHGVPPQVTYPALQSTWQSLPLQELVLFAGAAGHAVQPDVVHPYSGSF
jgi:hypothetical protein